MLQTQVDQYVLIASIVNAHEETDSPSNLLNIKEMNNKKSLIPFIRSLRHLTSFCRWHS